MCKNRKSDLHDAEFHRAKLPTVDKIKSKSSKPDYFSSIELGHSKSMEYEEINGLDEYNGKSSFNTFITRNKAIIPCFQK